MPPLPGFRTGFVARRATAVKPRVESSEPGVHGPVRGTWSLRYFMRLLGPIFWYDLVRVARRQPLALWRTGYGLGLLLALFLLYFTAFPGAWLGGTVAAKDAS